MTFPLTGSDDSTSDKKSKAVTMNEVRKVIDEGRKKVATSLASGDEVAADVHRIRIAIALWSLVINNANHDNVKIFHTQAYRWTEQHLTEVDLNRFTNHMNGQQPAIGGSGDIDGEAVAAKSTGDPDPSPGQQAAADVIDRIRPPKRSLDELQGEQLHDELNDVLEGLELALELDDHPAFAHRTIGNVLFTGPPGTGKSTAGEGLAQELLNRGNDFQFLPIKGQHFKNHLVGASEEAVERIFEQADAMGPTVIFIDEFEDVATRGNDNHEVTNSITNTLLSLLEGGQAAEDVVLIGATNRPQQLDPAIRNRFEDNIVEFTEPPAEVKPEILLKKLKGPGIKIDFAPETLDRISYDGLVGRDLERAATRAMREAKAHQESRPYNVTFTYINDAVTKQRKQKQKSLASQ